MAAKSNTRNMILSLAAVCLVCSGILGVVYSLTAEPIAQSAKKQLQQALSQVLPEGSQVDPEAVILQKDGVSYECYKAETPEGGSAWAVKSSSNGFGGAVTVLVGVKDGAVCSTCVLSHSETPGLGAKCAEQQSLFVTQFEGKTFSDLVLKKDGGQLDAITGSTITSRAYTLAVANAVALIAENYE